MDKNNTDYKDHSGYKSLSFYVQSGVIHDFTVEFAKVYIDKIYKDYSDYITCLRSPGKAENTTVCLINQTNQLLDQKLSRTEEEFSKPGGLRKNLFKKRVAYKKKSQQN